MFLLSLLAATNDFDTASPTTSTNTTMPFNFGLLMGEFPVVFLIIFILAIIITVIFLMDIYDWGMRKPEEFPQSLNQKKKWFWLFFLGIFAYPVLIIPFLGIFIYFVIDVLWIVLLFVYFFTVRKLPRETKAKTSTQQPPQEQQPPQVQQPPEQPMQQ